MLASLPLAVQLAIGLALAALLYVLRAALAARRAFLEPDSWKRLPLAERTQLTHNTVLLRFALPTPATRLGLPTGRHITLKGEWEGVEVMRPYTPVTDDDTVGHVDFVVKVYPQGRVSRLLGSLKPGESISAKGPRGRFVYAPGAHTAVGMVAGGTGVTPMLQVARALLKDPRAAATTVSLLFANVTEADILCREALDGLVAAHPGRFRVTYTLDEPGPGWGGGRGRVSAEMLKAALPPPGPGVMVCRCGPGPMNKAVAGLLEELGYDADACFEF